MTVEENFESTLEEIKKVYSFLTEGEPSPDDEIEARDILLKLFNDLREENTKDDFIIPISKILEELDKWDTLELWFSETSIPNEISRILDVPELKLQEIQDSSEEVPSVQESPKNGEAEIDLTDIFNKVSDQFKGEIDNLKGKIDDLKKELERKDETLKVIADKKKPQKIIPKRESRLPPPKIKIPIIKRPIKPPEPKEEPIDLGSEPEPEPEIELKETPVLKPVDLTPIKFETKIDDLTPIPSIPEEPIVEEKELTPIPKKRIITPIVIEDSEDIPLITEKRVTTPVFVADEEAEEPKKITPFSVEKPKISSVSIEEIETETIQSTSSELFNVFSSVGKSKEQSSETPKPQAIQIEVKEEKKKKKDIEPPVSDATPFINFNDSEPKPEIITSSTDIEDLSSDKDALYQELIALEGRRYSLEKNFKDLEKSYNKGSIADNEYKGRNNKLKVQLDEITTRINNIRRIISSL